MLYNALIPGKRALHLIRSQGYLILVRLLKKKARRAENMAQFSKVLAIETWGCDSGLQCLCKNHGLVIYFCNLSTGKAVARKLNSLLLVLHIKWETCFKIQGDIIQCRCFTLSYLYICFVSHSHVCTCTQLGGDTKWLSYFSIAVIWYHDQLIKESV